MALKFLFAPVFLCACISFSWQQAPVSKTVLEKGKLVYTNTCVACHQADGEGVPRMNPSLVKTSWVLGNKQVLIGIILNGLKGGEIEIDGDRFHNPMPPQKQLTDQQIADVLSFVRNSFGNKASVVTAQEVKKVRAQIK